MSPYFREKVRLIFLENWRNQFGFWKDFFLVCCLEKMSLRFREEVRLIFLKIWGNESGFWKDFLRLLFGGNESTFQRRSEMDFFGELDKSVRVLKGSFWGCYLENMSPHFREEVRLIFLENWRWSVRVLKGFFLGCCLEETSPHFREEVRLSYVRIWRINPCFERAF